MHAAGRRCDCAGHTRSELFRAAASEAGRGLPSIEPGMPLPAGTGLSRRSLLLRSAGMALTIYGADALGPGAFEHGVASAASGAQGRVLVSVFLNGGCDSLTVLAPTGEPRYPELRPTLGLQPGQGERFGEDDRLEWHPSCAALATLHREGKLCAFPAIGYEGANQSHFTSRHYYELGELNPSGRVGWLGRFLDLHGDPDNPLQGLSVDYGLAPALAPAQVPVAAFPSPSEYAFYAYGLDGEIVERMLSAHGLMGFVPEGDPALSEARAAVAQAHGVRQQLSSFSPGGGSVAYPAGDPFPERLAAVAAMLSAGLPLRCVALTAAGGYDTHADQAASLFTDLKLATDSLLAFQRDLEARGLDDRVLVSVWSEFGRRPEQNANGTDHGAAGLGFVVGSRARGEMVGEFPGLETLDELDNLRATSDFRAMYCSLLEQWLEVDAAPIIPGAASLGRPRLVR